MNSSDTTTSEPETALSVAGSAIQGPLIAPPLDPDTGEPVRVRSLPEEVRRICACEGRILFPLRCEGGYKTGYRAPGDSDWQTTNHLTADLLVWVQRGGWLGLLSASIGLWCVDLDLDVSGLSDPDEREAFIADAIEEARRALTKALGSAPLGECRTRRGAHFLFPVRDGETINNGRWTCGPWGGELRGHSGYVVLWDAAATFQAMRVAVHAEGVSPDPIRCHLRGNGKAPATRTATGKTKANGKATKKSNGTAAKKRPSAPPSAKLQAAVRFLGPEHLGNAVDYDDWVKVGFAIHHDTGGNEAGFSLWDEWSRQFANYPCESEPTAREKWASFIGGTRRPITARSIYKMARAFGWRDPARRTKREAAVADGAFPAKNASALKMALERLYIQVRLNERSAWPEFRRGTGPWEIPDDAYSAALREEVAERFRYVSEHRGEAVPMRFGKDGWWEAIYALVHERRVDPFVEWLDALPGWDGTSRLDTWLEQCWHFPSGVDSGQTTPLPLVRWAAQHLLLGAIWRAQFPGCKLDEMVVLVGPGGTGKSTAMPFLFPPEYRRDWFSDQFDFLEKRQARTESLLGSVIVEASEMAGSTRAENATVKAFLSGTFDRVRLAYRRDPQVLPRRCILVGTGDHDDVLPNDPNLRRFVVVRVQARGTAAETVARVRQFLDVNREQLWAEACVRFKAGVQAHLPPELASLQREVAENYRYRNESVENALAEIEPCRVRDGVTISQLVEFTGLHGSSEGTLAKALRALGWTRSRKRNGDGGRRTLWFPPEPESGQGGQGVSY